MFIFDNHKWQSQLQRLRPDSQDSGHETKPGESPAAFALNDEAFVNFAHASYKKVRDAAISIMRQAYSQHPTKLYFVGSSEGGREALTMAQRYPADFDGVFARVPVINWTALNHASAQAGIVTMGDAWLSPAHVKLARRGATGLPAVDRGREPRPERGSQVFSTLLVGAKT